MKVTIDNLDGAGAVDCSAALCTTGPLKIARTLNAPSICSGMLDVSDAGLAVPVRRGRAVVTAANGTVLFTGYIATDPEAVYAGTGVKGSVYRYAFSAVSDEWLLDKQSVPLSGAGLAQSGGQLLTTLTNRVDAGLFTTTGVRNGLPVGVYEPLQTESWSANAGGVASATYAAYRVLNGSIGLQPAGTVTHALSDGDGSLQVATLKTTAVKELANDVTVSGEIEPTAYVTETFAGDGTTTVFQLSEDPFRPKKAANSVQFLTDNFNEAVLDTQIWQVADPGSHLGLGASGLTMTGGNGFDGQTTLTAIDQVEMGGSLVIEAGNLQLGGASAGVVCGLYKGAAQSANCFVGYNVRQSGGNTVAVPFVNGAEAGTVFTMLQGHTYTLRIRLHCVEMQRVLQNYYAMVDGVVASFGGGLVSAPMSVVFELQDLGAASNTPATVLYDGSVVTSPANCTFAAVNSVQLIGSMGYCRITQTGSGWVVSTLPSGVKMTRLIGVAGEGVDCKISAAGKVTFFAGRVPVAGELVTVTYRGRLRAVARLADEASVAQEAAGGMPGTAQWLGKVVKPAARSSMDCEGAAMAVLSFSASRAAAVSGSYVAVNSQDVWPGDVLAITSAGQTMSVMVRKVEIVDGMGRPEMLTYRMAFANDWAEGLGLTLSEAIAVDALLPQKALSSTLPVGGSVLANLQELQVVSATGTALQVDSGTAPPTGGGFEVRRRDGDFGPGVDQDLVLRSPVRSFSIPREGQVEHYYVRMFDGSTPPLYSRFSSAVFTNLPVSE
ncbi:hypothetical protein RBB79_19385 [Tunturiibacter empetritectus]|uniref:Uncharacterized protein n=1 Tax=Tunturiibacter lichenicola TaxID=2051959 RepID=A0A852VN41_9BACT|nr:hypothetical protein [Edaphobacter lichenicola]NYF91834.1 hypothetical protein [Edaphobacter lichenicola]